jgi:medium-chain acyl-[acyl-carrier-protein] hydrolase
MNTTSMTTEAGSWVMPGKRNATALLRLLCFPYAGGGALIYRGWPDNLPNTVEVCPIQLPGRETRMSETPFRKLSALADTLTIALRKYGDKPFAFFGHSMGAKIAFEVARRLRLEGSRQPVHLFVSGSPAPHLPDSGRDFYNLPKLLFVDELRRLNGTPTDVLDHPELMDLVLPMLRADFEVVQTYAYTEEAPLACPITAFGGLEDEEVPGTQLAAWAEHTTAPFRMRMFPGDHFFLNRKSSLLLPILARELQEIAMSSNRSTT